MGGWIEERLRLSALRNTILRKPFPVHHTFFLGEIVLFAFVALGATGIYLALSYEASSLLVEVGGQKVPAAYSSILYIDSLPFGRVIRSVHHWSAHVMVAVVLLHLLRNLLSGAYKRPREINWLIGLALLSLTVVSAFTGYALPDDAYSVTATKVGYGIAAAVPWIGGFLADGFFGGPYPTAQSLPRLLGLHMVWLPFALLVAVTVHLLVMWRQKHTEPPYAEKVAWGRTLGVPLAPQQLLMMLVVFFFFLAVVFAVAGAMPAHPVEAYGPPTVATPSVKPDWYFLWVYGILELVPSSVELEALGTRFTPEFFGGVLVMTALGLAAILLPFVNWSRCDLHYLELPSRHPWRTAVTLGLIAFLLTAVCASYAIASGVSAALLRASLVAVPTGVVLLVLLSLRIRRL